MGWGSPASRRVEWNPPSDTIAIYEIERFNIDEILEFPGGPIEFITGTGGIIQWLNDSGGLIQFLNDTGGRFAGVARFFKDGTRP